MYLHSLPVVLSARRILVMSGFLSPNISPGSSQKLGTLLSYGCKSVLLEQGYTRNVGQCPT